MSEITIRRLERTSEIRETLVQILIEVVAQGGSVSFMHPLSVEVADGFCDRSLEAADRGERVVLGGFVEGVLVGTVTLLLDFPPNQPHRAEIAKLMTRPSHRGRGVARSLMKAAQQIAIDRNRTLLVLDTAIDGGASGLYEVLGFSIAGIIPDFAFKPQGGLTATAIYWKRIGNSSTDIPMSS